jgi:hypothetical protein
LGNALIPLIVAGLVLPRGFIWFFCVAHCIFILLDYYLLPHTADLNALVVLWKGDSIAYARPILIQIVGALLLFLWARSTDQAIRRADRAEEIAALEHTLADQKRQLDIGIQQILQTHVRAANGDYTARAPLGQDNILWQIASSLNNLLSRLQRSGQAEHQLTRTNDELRRLAAAIDDAQSGRKPIWPAPTGTAADLILERIRGGRRRAAPQAVVQEQRPPDGPSQPMSGFPGGPQSAWQEPAAQWSASPWPDQMAPAPQQMPPMEPAQNGGWPMPMEADAPMGEPPAQNRQDANPWAFPQDER